MGITPLGRLFPQENAYRTNLRHMTPTVLLH